MKISEIRKLLESNQMMEGDYSAQSFGQLVAYLVKRGFLQKACGRYQLSDKGNHLIGKDSQIQDPEVNARLEGIKKIFLDYKMKFRELEEVRGKLAQLEQERQSLLERQTAIEGITNDPRVQEVVRMVSGS
jgi:hypothetical protein